MQRRGLLACMLIATALLLASTGCREQQQPRKPTYGKLKAGFKHRLNDGSRTNFTVPSGWSGDYFAGLEPVYREDSLVGTVSVLPYINKRIQIQLGDDHRIDIQVFRSASDALKQQSIYREIASHSTPSPDEPPPFTFQAGKRVSVYGTVEFYRPEYEEERMASVVLMTRNDAGASFQLSAELPASHPMFKRTRSPAEMGQRLLEFLRFEY